MKHLLLARLYQAKFLDTSEQAHVNRVHSEFDLFQDNLNLLDRKLRNSGRRQKLADVQQAKKIYVENFDNLVNTIQERNKIVTGILDKLGSEFEKATEAVKLSVKAEQDQLGPRLQSSNKKAVSSVLIASIFALVIGIGAGLYLSRIITNPVFEIKNIADEIALGNLDTEITVSQRDEIGQLADAFARMKDNLKEKAMHPWGMYCTMYKG